jgi:hypothetical protein
MPGRSSLIMTADAAEFSETTGYSAIPLPSNGVSATQQAVHDLEPTEILVDEGDGPTSAATQMSDALNPASAAIVPNTGMVVLAMAARR